MNRIWVTTGVFLLFLITSCQKDEIIIGNVTLPVSTKIIESAVFQSNLVSIDSSNFTLSFLAGEKVLDNLKTGDVLVIDQGTGLLRKVKMVESKNGDILVFTEQASLTDAIKEGNLELNQKLTGAMVQSVRPLSPGITIKPATQKSGESADAITYEYTISQTYGDQDEVVLTGSFSLEPSIRVDAEIKGAKLINLRTEYTIEENVGLTAEMPFVEYSKTFSKEIEFTFGMITVFVGPVPVIVQPILTLEVGVGLNLNAKLTTGVNQSYSYSLWIEYDPVKKWSSGQQGPNQSLSFTKPSLEANASVRPFVKPGIKLLFYGVLAPYLEAEVACELKADLMNDPWWTLGASLDITGGVKMEIFDWTVLSSPTIYFLNKTWPITNSNTAGNNQPPRLPRNPSPVNNGVGYPLDLILTWECSDPDKNDVLTYDVYTGVTNLSLAAENQSTNAFAPTYLQSETEYLWRVDAKDNHGNKTVGPVWKFKTAKNNQPPTIPTLVKPTNGAIDLTVPVVIGWNCTDPENDPIVYDIYLGTTISPSIIETSWNSKDYSLTNINGEQRYYWKIIARDDHGNQKEGPTWYFTTKAGNTSPIASFTTIPASGTTATVFQFNASGSTDAETPVNQLKNRWDFENDGRWDINYSTTKTTTHQFPQAGTYNVLLEVTDGGGLTDTEIHQVVVSGGTGGDGTFTYDGRTYAFKTIGTQTWMTENLAYLPTVNPSSASSSTSPYYYVYGYEGSSVSAAKGTANYTTYGVLYNWTAAKIACPSGWHLPSDEEFKTLEKFLGMSNSDANGTSWRGASENVGTKLKNSTGWNSGNGTNIYGFSMLPSGLTLQTTGFDGIGIVGDLALSTENDQSKAWYRAIAGDRTSVDRMAYSKANGYSVRCLKD